MLAKLLSSTGSSSCRSCSWEARKMLMPFTPVRAIIRTANMESRASVGFCSPVVMVLAISASSTTIAEPVRIKVP